MSTYFNFTVITAWCTFIAALVLLDRRTTRWRLFIPLMVLTLSAESIGWYMYWHMKIDYNALPFNCLMLTSISFFAWFLSGASLLQPVKKVILICIGLFLISGLINLFFFQGLHIYNAHTESLGDIMLSIICCYFLFKMISDTDDMNLARYDYFWLTVGILFYTLGSALLYQFSTVLENYYKRTQINAGNYINYALNLVLYSCLIIAFIWRRKTTRL